MRRRVAIYVGTLNPNITERYLRIHKDLSPTAPLRTAGVQRLGEFGVAGSLRNALGLQPCVRSIPECSNRHQNYRSYP